jgi:hypothetical protein
MYALTDDRDKSELPESWSIVQQPEREAHQENNHWVPQAKQMLVTLAAAGRLFRQ